MDAVGCAINMLCHSSSGQTTTTGRQTHRMKQDCSSKLAEKKIQGIFLNYTEFIFVFYCLCGELTVLLLHLLVCSHISENKQQSVSSLQLFSTRGILLQILGGTLDKTHFDLIKTHQICV